MAFKFLQIGKANTEIDRLTAELCKVTKERDEAQAAVGENTSEVAKQADAIQADLLTAKQTISTLSTERDTLNTAVASKDSEIKSLNDKLAAKDGEVKVQVARQLQNAQAQIGTTPVPSVPDQFSEKAAKTNGSKSEPFGMERVLASCREDLKKAGYVHPSER